MLWGVWVVIVLFGVIVLFAFGLCRTEVSVCGSWVFVVRCQLVARCVVGGRASVWMLCCAGGRLLVCLC